MEEEKKEKKKKSVGRRIWGVTWRVLCGVLAVLIVGVAAFMAVDRIRFHAFYKKAERTFATPGLQTGFVPQGFDYDDENGVFLSTGYMSNKKASRVYVMDGKGGEYYVSLAHEDGSAYKGHTGGIVHNGEYAYITGDNGLDVFPYRDILDGKATVEKVGEIRTYLDPAYCYIAGEYLLAGSFYRKGNFETADYERMDTPSGEHNPAIMTAFKLDDAYPYGVNPTPCAVISTRNAVQGMCVTPDGGKVILSTSYALSASKLYVYDSTKLKAESGYTFCGETEDGEAFSFENVARVFLDSDSHIDTIKAPPMSEELVYLDGKIYIMTESASNRYLFGNITSGRRILAYPYK